MPQPQAGEELTQLDTYRRRYGGDPGLVVVGVGGNDAGFSTIGLMCLAPGDCSRRADLWTASLGRVRENLRETYRHLDAVFPRTPVVVVPYPDPVHLSDTCDDVALTYRERRFVHEFVTDGLNRAIEETAAQFGFHYLAPMEEALATAHLQLCDPLNGARPGLHFIRVRSVAGVAEQRFNPKNWSHGSLHPNERGHAAMLRTFQTWLPDLATMPARTSDASDTGGRSDSSALPPGSGTAQPQCDVLDASPAGCRTQGMRWAKGQVRALLVGPHGWLLLVPLVAVWLAALAFFAYQRRPRGTADRNEG